MVMRTAKLSLDMQNLHRTEVTGIGKHNERQPGENHSNPDIDDSRTHLNYSLVDKEGRGTLLDRIDQRIQDGRDPADKRKIQSNAILLQSHVVQVNKEYFDGLGPAESKRFFQTVYDHYCEKFGKENILSAEVHMDEKSPHIHIERMPMVEGKLAGGLFKNKEMAALHTDCHRYLKEHGFDVQRGEPSKIKKERVDLATYKKQELQRQERELEAKEKELGIRQAGIDNRVSTEQEISEIGSRARIEKPSIFNGNKEKTVVLWEADYNRLTEAALAGAAAVVENPQLKQDLVRKTDKIESLEKENGRQHAQIASLQHTNRGLREITSKPEVKQVIEKVQIAEKAQAKAIARSQGGGRQIGSNAPAPPSRGKKDDDRQKTSHGGGGNTHIDGLGDDRDRNKNKDLLEGRDLLDG
jgi:hypothetical protein